MLLSLSRTGRGPAGRSGFSLVELSVVLVLLAVIAGLGVPTFETLRTRSGEQTAVTSAQALLTEASGLHLAAHGSPVVLSDGVASSELAALNTAAGDVPGQTVDATWDGTRLELAAYALGADSYTVVWQAGVWSAYIGVLPDVPGSLTVTRPVGSDWTQAAVDWEPVGGDVTGYVVQSSTDGATWSTVATVDASVSEATVGGLTPQTGYFFQVAAVNSTGTGPFTAPMLEPTVTATVPGAPGSVTATAASSAVNVSWTAPVDDGGAAIVSYTATASPGGATCTAAAPATTCTISGLSNGTSYTVTVTATNAVGTSGASTSSAPATPQVQTATFAYTGATQTWVVPAGVTSIQVVARGASGGCGYDSSTKYGLGGAGGQVTTTMTVTPGETLHLNIGGSGYSARYLGGANCGGAENGWNGGGAPGRASWDSGGGGGATDIRRGGTALADRVVVAGGGGGAPDTNYFGIANAGGFGGGNGNGNGGPGVLSGSRPNGAGATQSAGGAGGVSQLSGGTGTLGQGGNGVWLSSSGCSQISSGGGGGYYGGGGGGASCSVGVGAGGGGSSYAGPGTSSTVYATAATRGNGSLVITY